MDAGASVAFVRTGIVLAREGGAMEAAAAAGPARVGGASWARVASSGRGSPSPDQVAAILHLLDRPDVTGPVNLAAPAPARQREHRRRPSAGPCTAPRSCWAPSPALRVVLGEFAGEILGSQRIVGDVLRDSGFGCTHPDLDAAVRWLVA